MAARISPADADQDIRRLRRAFVFGAAFVAALWGIKLVELACGLDLSAYGVYPRRPMGLLGILLAPLIHASLAHLLANTAPALVLLTAILYGYPRAARWVLPVVYLGSGLCVWVFGRPGYHLGASGLIFGLMFFIFTIGVLRWDRRAIALSLAVFLLYGGMIWGVLPSDPKVSFEYHFFGASLGILLAIPTRRLDPSPPEKRYSWEDADDLGDDWPFVDRPGGDSRMRGSGGDPEEGKSTGRCRGNG
jgi:membrane associated rhomboid family serine protease